MNGLFICASDVNVRVYICLLLFFSALSAAVCCMVDGVCVNRVDLNAKVYGFDQAAPRPAGS